MKWRRDDRAVSTVAAQAAPLTVRAVPHKTITPHELLPASVTVVWFQTRVGLHVFREVMLHLKLLGADGAVKGPQVQVHVDVPVPHAFVRERFPAVTHEDLAGTTGPSAVQSFDAAAQSALPG